LLPGGASDTVAGAARLLEEFLAAESATGTLRLPLEPLAEGRAMVHGHCHQKAFGAMQAMERTLSLIPELEVQTIQSGCCGMAGAFGYETQHFDTSMQMAELDLLPRIRQDADGAILVADGTSCRHQIKDGTGRQAVHVARVLQRALHHSVCP
jgi:Fe-S oxidoreductase